MSLAFSRLPPSAPFYSLIHYFLTRFPTVLPVQCDRGWDRVFLVGGARFWVLRRAALRCSSLLGLGSAVLTPMFPGS